jgi:hypothetical protein
MLKILWIGMILLGFGLIAVGAIGLYLQKGTWQLASAGMACMGLGMMARMAYFRRR